MAATNSLLQRARATMASIRPDDKPIPSDRDQKDLVERFTEAWRSGSTDALLALLDESAHLTMPPHKLEFIGPQDVANLLLDAELMADYELIEFVPVSASSEYGFATYVREPGGSVAVRHCVMLFGHATTTASKITGFTEDRIFDMLDLPATVAR